jgi:DNA repair protein RadC
VVLLDGASQVLRIKLVMVGLLNRTSAHAREIFRSAILESAASVILVHNHPSGNLEPSRVMRRSVQQSNWKQLTF